ncbi:hypothetical protein DUI87_04972 [Hirundo rustica rustica]|uniref:Uncharacterized protein n=1 Tax=Hirundo rustica rustica TaxID=333673 RepID=A0A3M0KY70_HIRRU|nr:hypothetical protein DUI87_04972 [Hirundo rustica rustica]
MEVQGDVEIYLPPMEEPPPKQVDVWEEAVILWETCGERGPAPVLEQPVLEGLPTMEEWPMLQQSGEESCLWDGLALQQFTGSCCSSDGTMSEKFMENCHLWERHCSAGE